MALTVNNLGTLTLLNILNRTTSAQSNTMNRLATGSKINKGSDDPAGLMALTSLNSELTAVNAGIANNQRTDSILGVADSAIGQISSLLGDIQNLASSTANDSALTADEKAANQSQIDDALASIDRIIGSTEFNGKKLLDGSLGIMTTVANAGAVTDVAVYGRPSGSDDTTLTVTVQTAASNAALTSVMTTSTSEDTSFSVQGKLGTAVISVTANENVSAVAYKINQAKAQTGVSAVMSGTVMNLWSADTGSAAFVRTTLISGSGVTAGRDAGVDAIVQVNGQNAAVDGQHVAFTGNGVGVSFDIGTLGAGSSTTLTVSGSGGATFQLGTKAETRATIGIDGLFSQQLGNATSGYLSTLKSGGEHSLLNDPNQAAEIARVAARQVATLRGRVGGFQKFQVQTSLASLTDIKEGLSKAKGVINDVDYAMETADLNRENVLMQSAMSLLGVANQQASQVLSLLR
jgi:flagellin